MTLPFTFAGQAGPIPLSELDTNFTFVGRGVYNVSNYGATPDGTGNLATALNAAIADGAKTIVIDEGASYYRLTSPFLVPSGVKIKAGNGRPEIKMENILASRMFVFSGVVDAGLSGVKLNGNHGSVPVDATVVFSAGASRCFIDDVELINAPSTSTGAIVISGTSTRLNRISFCYILGANGTAIGITGGTSNDILFNQTTDNGGFGIRLGEGASRNLIQGNHTITSLFEPIGLTESCFLNQIICNYCEDSHDNGISITGYRNTVQGNICIGNARAGIGVWGEYNAITGNCCFNNNGDDTNYWSGIWIAVGFGGTGQYNTVAGNSCDDDRAVPLQFNDVRIEGAGGYIAWAPGQTIAINDYRVNGLNIYRAVSAGTTADPGPVNTSGTAPDGGGVLWQYVRSFLFQASPRGNTVSAVVPGRTKSGTQYADAANWTANSLFCHGSVHTQWTISGWEIGSLPDYVDDAAAALGGIEVGGLYRNGSVVQVRVT